jgi:hypothetical protein
MEQKELAQAKIDVRIYENGSDLMDEKTVVLLTEPADLAEGKQFSQLIVLLVIELMRRTDRSNLTMINGFWGGIKIFSILLVNGS